MLVSFYSSVSADNQMLLVDQSCNFLYSHYSPRSAYNFKSIGINFSVRIAETTIDEFQHTSMTGSFESVNPFSSLSCYHSVVSSAPYFFPLIFLAEKLHCASTSNNSTCLHYGDKWYDPMLNAA